MGGIDSLPDDVLGQILSLLPVREVVRTSLLSRRWQYLWLNIPVFNFSVSPEEMKHDNAMDIGVERHRFIIFANNVVAAYQTQRPVVNNVTGAPRGRTPSLVKFRVRYSLDIRHSSTVASWTQFAAEKGVQCIELNCFPECCSKRRRKHCSFPALGPEILPNLWQLKSLSLDYVDITSEQLGCLLSICKLLEKLRIFSSRTLNDLNFDGTDLLRVKSLDISSCPNLTSFCVFAPTPDLVSVHFLGSQQEGTKLYLDCAPRLVDLLIGGWRYPVYLTSAPESNYFAQLESLNISLESPPSVSQGKKRLFPEFPVMACLKHLTVQVDGINHSYNNLYEINSLIKKTPSLQHLTIDACRHMKFHSKRHRKLKILPLLHDLQVFRYVNFCGSEDDEKLILHLLRTAVSPDKLILEIGESGNDFVFETLESRAMGFKSSLPEGAQMILREHPRQASTTDNLISIILFNRGKSNGV